jgi:hypothetical protein
MRKILDAFNAFLTTRWIIAAGLVIFAIACLDGRLWLKLFAAGSFVVVGLLHSFETYCKYLQNGSAEPPAASER